MTQQLLDPPPVTGSTRWTTPIRAVAGIAAAVMLFFGTASVVGYFMIQTDTETKVFPEPLTRVQITGDTIDVVIRTGTRSQGTTVISRGQSSLRTARHSEIVTDGVLQIRGSCGGGWVIADACEMDFEIVVPPGTPVEANTTTGDVSVRGTGGPVTVKSATGNIRVNQAGGAIKLTTNVGDITGSALTGGTVNSRSNTGDIRLSFTAAPDQIKASTNVGDIRVTVPDDTTTYQVITDVGLGDRHIDIPTDSSSKRIAHLTTSTGDVQMDLD